MLWPVLKALLGHYRRHPLQLILIWIGLTLGVSVLIGVTAINNHAQQSYSYSEKLFTNPLPYRIRSKNQSHKIPQSLYHTVKRSGFNQCIPFDFAHVTSANGDEFTLQGFSMSALKSAQLPSILYDEQQLSFDKNPNTIMVSQSMADRMKWHSGDLIELNDSIKTKAISHLGPIVVDEQDYTNSLRIIADISLLRKIKPSLGFSAIACADMDDEQLDKLRTILPSNMTVVMHSKSELETLTRAFHMNLNAMGMLSFVVGLFIFYQAMLLSFVQRQLLVGSLRQLGVSSWQLALILVLELFILVFFSWVCGNAFGLILANQLLPSVSMSLKALYDADISLVLNWTWLCSLSSLVMALSGAFLACIWPMYRLLKSQPIHLSLRLSLVRFANREFRWQALVGSVFAFIALVLYNTSLTQVSGTIIVGLMLFSVALFTPYFIWSLFYYLSYRLPWVKGRWFFTDAATSMSYRGVATMAFMLAMSANIGIETTIGSFRDTTERWLDQRLASDIYVNPNNHLATSINQWLLLQPEVDKVWQRWVKDIAIGSTSWQVVSIGDSDGEMESLTVKLAVPDYWYYLHHSRSVMISESVALKLNFHLGDVISLPQVTGEDWKIVGIYYDYGNPYNQILLSQRNWLLNFSDDGEVELGIILREKYNAEYLKHRLKVHFRLNDERVVDNNNIHTQAMQIFDRTFLIIDTLGYLTLVIAIFGLFFATVAGEISRQKHTALLHCFGISSHTLMLVGSLQLLVFGIISACVAIPLGLAFSHLVIEIVLKPAFGWSIPLQVVPWTYGGIFAMSLLSLIVAGALPIWKLSRKTPIKSLRDAL